MRGCSTLVVQCLMINACKSSNGMSKAFRMSAAAATGIDNHLRYHCVTITIEPFATLQSYDTPGFIIMMF